MIRREAGHDLLLITQTDHAVVAQQLAEHFGNAKFAKPSAKVITATGLHDAGWPLHDDEPTLNDRQFPLDVFEVPRPIALRVWAASAARAAAVDPYAGLLVSLHSLSLSIYATSATVNHTEKFDVKKMQDQFEVNKFQHREVERQELLRRELKFNANLPLKHGLAEAGASEIEDQLRFDFRLLQAMDLISLCLCCSKVPQEESNDVLKHPGTSPVKLHLFKSLDGAVHVSPWPFNRRRIELSVPCRRITGKRFDSIEQFRIAYQQATSESLRLTVGI